jgi:hypothetical protein
MRRRYTDWEIDAGILLSRADRGRRGHACAAGDVPGCRRDQSEPIARGDGMHGAVAAITMRTKLPLVRCHWLALGVSVLAACSTEPPLGTQTSAVINGDLATDDPAVVALMDGDYFFCTGTVVSPHVVLTAAHCLEGGPPPDGIFFGIDSNDPGSGQILPVASVKGHEDYDGNTGDIAVVELGAAAPAAAVRRNTTALSAAMAGDDVRVVGFGLSVDNENSNEAGVKLTGLTTFDSLEEDYMLVTPQGNQSGCYGDSGGPNFMTIGGQEVLAGVTSFGTEDSCLAGYGGNTDVERYNEWIDAFILSVGDSVDPGPTCVGDGVCEADCAADPDCEDPDPGDDDGGDDTAGGDDDGDGGDDDGGQSAGGGCSAGAGGDGGFGLVLLGLVGMLARRRYKA